MKGIVLAGGTGSRLWPITLGISKQLLPVYDKPLIHYPISTLMLAGIREILIITTPSEQDMFRRLLGDGSQYGINLSFELQPEPRGIAQAFTIGRSFVGDEKVALILGDNIFYGVGLGQHLKLNSDVEGAQIFAQRVPDPERYGVIEIGEDGLPKNIIEKPESPKSNLAVTGLYFYDNTVLELAMGISPSARGELEITSINQAYLKSGKLKVDKLERGTVWFDTGTFDSLYAASSYVKLVEDRQGIKIACLEEIAWRNNWISSENLDDAAKRYGGNPWGEYLLSLLL
jgi:glucose-1-phosphate thymidylyltransferase